MKKALLLLGLFALSAVGQSSNITGIPDGVTVFTITLKSGEELHGAIQLKAAFINDYSEAEASSMTNVTVISDVPSAPGKRSVNRINIALAQPETPQKREKRYNDEGFVIVTGHDGKEMLMPEETQLRADRLAELQHTLAQQEENLLTTYEETPPPMETEATGPGFIALWGRHILILVGGGALLFGIIKVCFS